MKPDEKNCLDRNLPQKDCFVTRNGGISGPAHRAWRRLALQGKVAFHLGDARQIRISRVRVPETQCNDVSTKPDWLFPQDGGGEHVPQNWHPTYVNYLFLALSTATAFSTTDVLPLTPRAKLLMMAEKY